MTTPPPITEPDPSALICPGDRVRPCGRCQRKTHKHGSGGSPLCQWCMAPVQENWGSGVRYVSTRRSRVPGWVKPLRHEDFCGPRHVLPDVKQINDAHAAEPGLAVVEVAAADDATAFAIQKLLAARCAIAPADRTTRDPGEPGVRLRFWPR